MAKAGGKEAMDRLRVQLEAFEGEERVRLAAESAFAAEVLERGRLQVVAGSVVIALLMIWFLLAMNRNLRRQARLAESARTGEARQVALLQAVPDDLYELHADGRVTVLSPSSGRRGPPPPELCAVFAEQVARQPGRTLLVFDWSDARGHEHEVRVVLSLIHI